jgi:hypothetical protein
MSELEIIKMWFIGFIVFALIRYALPNYILGKTIDLKVLFITSSCYGFALLIRKYLMDNV